MDGPSLPEPDARPIPRRRGARVAALVCWGYLLLIAGLIFYLRTRGDHGRLATIILFSPRWIFAAPVVLMFPLVIYRGCRLPILLLIFAALFPLMGFCIGWHRFGSGNEDGQPMRIVTFNLHLAETSNPDLVKFMAGTHPDVLALEETPGDLNRSDLPADLTHIVRRSEMCLASRYPIVSVTTIREDIAYRYTLKTPAGPVDFIGVHLSSPHVAIRDAIDGQDLGPLELARNITNRRDEAEKLRKQIEQTTDGPLVIAGDFNLAPDSPLYTQNFSALSDAFESTGLGFGWTYFHQFTMVRIDHVVFNRFFTCKSCMVGPRLVSPHRPVIADLILKR